MLDRAALLSIRRSFQGLAPSAHTQMGRRAIASAIRYAHRADMADFVAEKAAVARGHLPFAIELDARLRAAGRA